MLLSLKLLTSHKEVLPFVCPVGLQLTCWGRKQKNPGFHGLRFGIKDVIFIYAACCVASVLMSYLMKQTKHWVSSCHIVECRSSKIMFQR